MLVCSQPGPWGPPLRLIICDEPVSALDAKELRDESDIALLFVTHDLAVVRQRTDRVYVLYRGEVVESGSVDDVLDHPQHPYTARLVASIPQSSPDWLARTDVSLGVAQVGRSPDDAWPGME